MSKMNLKEVYFARTPATRGERLAFLAWGDFHAGSRFARFTLPEEKRGLLVVTARSFLYLSGAKKSEDWMNIGMKRSHSQSRCSLIRTKGRVGRDPVHPLCFKKKVLYTLVVVH